MATEPEVVGATVRFSVGGEDPESYDIECQFSDGQKFAPISVDGDYPGLAQRICAALTVSEQLWRSMTSAPKDGTVILVLLTGSDVPHAVRWLDKDFPKDGAPGWYMTWDHYQVTDYDGPICWMQCPPLNPPSEGVVTSYRRKAIDDILSERERQIQKEGWTLEHDDAYVAGELAMAAVCYAFNSVRNMVWYPGEMPVDWPWDAEWWKPTTPRRDLIKAAALILAEIERIDREANHAQKL